MPSASGEVSRNRTPIPQISNKIFCLDHPLAGPRRIPKRNRPTMNTKAQRKLNLSALCDADQYEPVVEGCLSEKQANILPPRHLANGLALMAELILTHYDGIAEAFDHNNGVEVSMKLQIGGQKDELKISYKPTSEVKDAAMAIVPDRNQAEMDFVKPSSDAKNEPEIVEAEVIPTLPAPMEGLPAPALTEEEQEAYDAGYDAALSGESYSTNPHPYDESNRSHLWTQWAEGWKAGKAELEAEANESSPIEEAPTGGEDE